MVKKLDWRKCKEIRMKVESHHQKEIVHILTDIFPGLALYQFSSKTLNSGPLEGKKPAIHLAIDVGRIIGDTDIQEAQRALAESSLPYTIYLFDLNGVSEHERGEIIASAKEWKLGL